MNKSGNLYVRKAPGKEEWREYEVPGYWISSEGRVASTHSHGGPRLLAQQRCGAEMTVRLAGRWLNVPRLVWQTFRGPIPDGMRVVHRNGASTMNDLGNLELVTDEESGRRNAYRRKLRSVIDIDTGRIYRNSRDAAERLGINIWTVRYYCDGVVENPKYHLRWYDRESREIRGGKRNEGSICKDGSERLQRDA